MILRVSPNCCKTCKPRSMHLNKHMQVCVANSFACTNVHFPFLSPKCSRCVHLSLSHNRSIDEEEVATQISGTSVQNKGIHDINLQFNVDGKRERDNFQPWDCSYIYCSWIRVQHLLSCKTWSFLYHAHNKNMWMALSSMIWRGKQNCRHNIFMLCVCIHCQFIQVIWV